MFLKCFSPVIFKILLLNTSKSLTPILSRLLSFSFPSRPRGNNFGEILGCFWKVLRNESLEYKRSLGLKSVFVRKPWENLENLVESRPNLWKRKKWDKKISLRERIEKKLESTWLKNRGRKHLRLNLGADLIFQSKVQNSVSAPRSI